MTSIKINVLGYGRHGKDTVAELLNKHFGLTFVSSSFFVGEKVMFDVFNSRDDLPSYETFDDCYADRHNHRGEWHRQISAYNTPDKARIAREVLEVSDMYNGMRCIEEYQSSRHLFNFAFWVDASERGIPPESTDSCTVSFDPSTMIRVSNGGSLEDLERRVIALGDLLELKQLVEVE